MLAVAVAAALSAVPAVAPGEQVALVASELRAAPGYRLALVSPSQARRGETCLGQIGSRRPSEGGSLVFSGVVPRTLPCRLADGTRTRSVRVRPGRRYRLDVAVPFPNEPLADDQASHQRRRVRSVRPGRACRRVAYLPEGEARARFVRAFRVRCGAARRVVRAARRPSGRCLTVARCSFRVRRYRCRGLTDEHTQIATVVRCTRKRARIIFVRT